MRPPRAPDAIGTVAGVDVFPGSVFQSGAPRALLNANLNPVFADVASDGKRMLAGVSIEKNTAPPPFNVVPNWPAGVRK